MDVIGKSCDVTAEMHWEESGEKAQVEVSVPVKTLDSGNEFRDGDILEILKAESHSEYSFRFRMARKISLG